MYSLHPTASTESAQSELLHLNLKETLSIEEDNIVDLEKPTHQSPSELILCKLNSGSGFSVRYGIRGIELKRYSGRAASISSLGWVESFPIATRALRFEISSGYI